MPQRTFLLLEHRECYLPTYADPNFGPPTKRRCTGTRESKMEEDMHSENGNAVIPSNELSVDAEGRSSDPLLATCVSEFTATAVVV